MCRLDRISAHLETFHRLAWICRDQNPCLSASGEVGEPSAHIAPGAAPAPGLGLLVLVPNAWRFAGGAGKLSQHRVCVGLSWPFPAPRFYVHPRYPKMSLICSSVARAAPTAGREWIAPLFLNFPPDAPYKWNLSLGSRQAAVWVCRGKAQSLRRGQDLSHTG